MTGALKRAMSSLIAVCQMTSTHEVSHNLSVVESLVRKASESKAKVVFFPEAFDYIGRSLDETLSLAQSLESSYVQSLKQLASQFSVWLSLGGFHEKIESDPTKLYNTHLLINNLGELVSSYRKIHLFDVDLSPRGIKIQESAFTLPGTKLLNPVDTPVGKLGLTTCYDLRFPELSLLLRRAGAEILTFPSAFTVHTGQAHWEALLRARAIETQCYVVAAAQSGQHNEKRTSFGHAMIVDPWGTVIAQCGQKSPSISIAEIDLEYLREVREQIPCAMHRRSDVYELSLRAETRVEIDAQTVYTFGRVRIPSAQVFYRTEKSFAFVNKGPLLNGHVLIASIREVPRYSNLQADELADLFHVVQLVLRRFEEHFGVASFTLAVQDGAAAGQTIEHVHVHLIPRKNGDLSKNDTIYDKLAAHDAHVETEHRLWRTDEQMKEEAAEYRKLFSDVSS